MGNKRQYTPHKRWSEHEVEILLSDYESSGMDELVSKLPGRSKSKIQNKAYLLGLRRPVVVKMTDDERRERKRQHMAKKRLEDPEGVRKYHRERHHKNHSANKQKMRDYASKRFFWSKAMKLRGPGRATHVQIARLWREQKGLCALTGSRLDRSAQLDHKMPKARGGGDEIDNLQWLSERANLAKRDLTDDEFIRLCETVMTWIGRRIEFVNSMPTESAA